MKNHSDTAILARIRNALDAAVQAISPFIAGEVRTEYKSRNDPVTEADRVANAVLREVLVRDDEGWLSEESSDGLARIQKNCVWIVDPLDGTREFVAGIPEWAISLALIQDGEPIAGGVCNPVSQETFLGCMNDGVTYNGKQCHTSLRETLDGAVILASRHEVERGEWEWFKCGSFRIKPVGSIAYKLALVAAGLAEATWTLNPKHEWDVAGGVALIRAAGGFARQVGAHRLTFNSLTPILPDLVAGGPGLAEVLPSYLSRSLRNPSALIDQF